MVSIEMFIYAIVIGLSGLFAIGLIALRSMGYKVRIRRITNEVNSESARAISETGDYMEKRDQSNFKEEVERMLMDEQGTTSQTKLGQASESVAIEQGKEKDNNNMDIGTGVTAGANDALESDNSENNTGNSKLDKPGQESGGSGESAKIVMKEDILGRVPYERGALYNDDGDDVFVVTGQLRKVYKGEEQQK